MEVPGCTMMTTKVWLVLLAATVTTVMAESYTNENFHQDHNDMQVANTDPFKSEFFKTFDQYWNKTSIFQNKDFDEDFWSTSDEDLLQEKTKQHKKHHKSNKEKKHRKKHKKADSVAVENNNETHVVAPPTGDHQDTVVQSFVRQQSSQLETNEPERPCIKNHSSSRTPARILVAFTFILCVFTRS